MESTPCSEIRKSKDFLKLKLIFVPLLCAHMLSAFGQERIEVTLDSTKDTSCTSPISYTPKLVSLDAGYWNVVAKSGAWQPFGANVNRYLHSFNVRIDDDRIFGSSSGVQDSVDEAVRLASSKDGRILFRLGQPQTVEAYIGDSLCSDNAGSESIEFVKVSSFKDNCNSVGNPCQVSSGNKYTRETDFSSGLAFERWYTSAYLADTGFGFGWRGSFERRIIVQPNHLILVRPNGSGEAWVKTEGQWIGDADSNYIVNETPVGFEIIMSSGESESYDQNGRLLSETDTNGKETQFAYNSNGFLSEVQNVYGHKIIFGYDQNRITTISDPNGDVYTYSYDNNGNLSTVVYPDTTPADDSDNPRKTYHYDNLDFPNHLTGITDENGDRYATYTYDADGKAISTEHAQTTNPVGQERFELDYQGGQP